MSKYSKSPFPATAGTQGASLTALELVYRRLGQIEHLLNAVLDRQERSTDTIAEKIRTSEMGIEAQILELRESMYSNWPEDDEVERKGTTK